MINSTKLYKKNEKNNTSKYVKYLAEGMHDWLEVKEKTGNGEISSFKNKIEKEISSFKKESNPRKFSSKILNKMEILGLNKSLLEEFKGVFIF